MLLDRDHHRLKKLGKAIREARLERGLSQEGLAALAGLDRTYVGGIERGERNVAILNLCRIARALDHDLHSLVKGLC
jgi:transcriptional regulator with XRE-family HTH domain